ncbi:MAG: hypothetical protein LBT30_02590 [Clostridiales bacterium]|jgi:hypothetical protein|nr:hypothetical protein [Clostridiales bacterium]
MAKKGKKDEIGYTAESACTHYDCEACIDKFECDYYIHTFCLPTSDALGADSARDAYQPQPRGRYYYETQYGDRHTHEYQAQAPLPQEQPPVQPYGQTVNAGYGLTNNQPIQNPGSGVQLSPIVIPVSFVPYTTQNQPLYQVETVMPEKEFIKHRGLAFFMFALSVATFFLFALRLVSGYTANNIFSGLLTGIPGNFPLFNESAGFDVFFGTADMTVTIGAHLLVLSVLAIFLTSIYNAVKYLVFSLNGNLKKGPSKSNIIILVSVIAIFLGIILLNAKNGVGIQEAAGLVFKNDASLEFRMNFGFYALLAVAIVLFFANSFITTERYLPVEGALPDEG